MISDEERREVAQKLRERTKKPMGKSMQRMFTETLGIYAHHINWMNPDKATNRWDVIVNYLADLIDRETCRNLAAKPADELLCSECGEHVDIAYLDSADDYHARYCPNCGAEVDDD